MIGGHIDEIVADYTEDAVFIIPAASGTAGRVRAAFTELLADLPNAK